MDIKSYFPMWNELTASHQQEFSDRAVYREIKKGTVVHNGKEECSGILLLKSGQLRAYIMSDEGREVTLYRLFELDVCVFSAPCIMPGVQFDMTIAAEKDTAMWIIPPDVYRGVLKESAALANYTNEIMTSRLSEIIWLLEKIMWKSVDKRVADFLIEEAVLEGTKKLKITHENIANHLGTAREVVTRMLRYFQNEGLVRLTRGTIELVDEKGLERLAKK